MKRKQWVERYKQWDERYKVPEFVREVIAEEVLRIANGKGAKSMYWLADFIERGVLVEITRDVIKEMRKEGRLVR